MQDDHKPISADRCRDLLTNAVPDIALRMVIGHMQTIYDKHTLIDMLLTRGFEPAELIHDFDFPEGHVKIVQRRSSTFGYTSYTPLGTVAAQIPWYDYMMQDDDTIMFLHRLTYKQFMTLPECPEHKLNNSLYRWVHTNGHSLDNIIPLLKNTPATKLWLENIDVHSIDPNAIPAGETAISMLSEYGVQSAYDMLMLRDDEINEIFCTDTNLAEHFRKQTIESVILLGTDITDIGTWSDDTLAQLKASHNKHAFDLYHNHRRGWIKHMSVEACAEIQQNLDAFMLQIHELFESTEPVESTKENPDA